MGGTGDKLDGANSRHQEESQLLLQGEIWNFYYWLGHPIKPCRILMIYTFLLNYSLYWKMENYCPHKDKTEKMAKYHSEDFKFLCFIHLDNTCEYSQQMQGCNVCEDCPVFGG